MRRELRGGQRKVQSQGKILQRKKNYLDIFIIIGLITLLTVVVVQQSVLYIISGWASSGIAYLEILGNETEEPAPVEGGEGGGGGGGGAPGQTYCVSDCAYAAKKCISNKVLRCDNFDSDPCVEWGFVETCGGEEVCHQGDCVCSEAWSCGAWGPCLGEGQQFRICTDVRQCGTSRDLPEEEQSCTPSCSDGVRNHGESGIDCGGPCKTCKDGELRMSRGINLGYQLLMIKKLFICAWLPLFLIIVIILTQILLYREKEGDDEEEEEKMRDFFG